MAERTCSVEGCDKREKGRGLCSGHLNRLRRYGSPTGRPEPRPALTCSVEGCTREHAARGLCGTHYRRWQKHGDPMISLLDREHDGTCTVEGCRSPYKAGGYCEKHYQRVAVNGSTDRRRDLPVADRFWSRVTEDANGCWLWGGVLDKDGYGSFSPSHSTTVRAHRWSYEAMVGRIPVGLELDHLCFVPACVNPFHLDPVTDLVNTERRDARQRALRG